MDNAQVDRLFRAAEFMKAKRARLAQLERWLESLPAMDTLSLTQRGDSNKTLRLEVPTPGARQPSPFEEPHLFKESLKAIEAAIRAELAAVYHEIENFPADYVERLH